MEINEKRSQVTLYLRTFAEREGFVPPLKTALFQYVIMELILYSPNYSPLLIYLGIAANAIFKDTQKVF